MKRARSAKKRRSGPGLLAIAIFTGLSSGELLGLQWQRLDFDKDIVRVRHQFGRTGHQQPLKTQDTRITRSETTSGDAPSTAYSSVVAALAAAAVVVLPSRSRSGSRSLDGYSRLRRASRGRAPLWRARLRRALLPPPGWFRHRGDAPRRVQMVEDARVVR
jgi:integrase